MARILEVRDVWAIAFENGNLLLPLDDDPGDSFLAYPTEHDAQKCLHSQYAKGYIEGKAKVVQLFVGLPPVEKPTIPPAVREAAVRLREWGDSRAKDYDVFNEAFGAKMEVGQNIKDILLICQHVLGRE